MKQWKSKGGYVRQGRRVRSHRQRYLIRKGKKFLIDFNPAKHKQLISELDKKGDLDTEESDVLKHGAGLKEISFEYNKKIPTKLIIKNNKIVGTLRIRRTPENRNFPPNTFSLSSLLINKSERGKGIGKETINNLLKNKAMDNLVFYSAPSAEKFYEKQGAIFTGQTNEFNEKLYVFNNVEADKRGVGMVEVKTKRYPIKGDVVKISRPNSFVRDEDIIEGRRRNNQGYNYFEPAR